MKSIFVAWNGKVNEAMHFFAHEDNKGGCEDLPCYSNERKMSFVPGANADYFDIVLTLSGTDITNSMPYRRKVVNGLERLVFVDGFYKTKTRIGGTTSLERFIEDNLKVHAPTQPAQ